MSTLRLWYHPFISSRMHEVMMQRFQWTTSIVYRDDVGTSSWPSSFALWNQDELQLPDDGTHFGFVQQGDTLLSCDSGEFRLSAGMYFSVPGKASIRGGRGIVATRLGFDGFFQIGGPVESRGRLRYINGCSDSLLISPVVYGDPCLNLLHIPAHTNQTQHTHPSLRAGVIVSGTGTCKSPEGDTPLTSGTVFMIPAESMHSFHTTDSDLLVVAWHPDSDTGPTHDDHPMVNRTIVDGVPASAIPGIRT